MGLLCHIVAFLRSFQSGLQITNDFVGTGSGAAGLLLTAVELIVPGLVVPRLVIPGLLASGLTVPGMVAPRLAVPGVVVPSWVTAGLVALH